MAFFCSDAASGFEGMALVTCARAMAGIAMRPSDARMERMMPRKGSTLNRITIRFFKLPSIGDSVG